MTTPALKTLALDQKKYFETFLEQRRHSLSSFSFQYSYIWKDLYTPLWKEIEGSLCIFFRNNDEFFMPIPPLGKKNDTSVVKQCFEIMTSRKTCSCVPSARIENIEESDLSFYQQAGYKTSVRSVDYVTFRRALTELKGDHFKSKRADINFFSKHNDFKCSILSPEDAKECLNLYSLWMSQRKDPDKIYQNMLHDNFLSLRTAFAAYNELGFTGKKITIDGSIKGFTFGFELNPETFCVLFETTDLFVKGLAQFLFKDMCQSVTHKYINMMDDSGLENLRKVKLSYHPQLTVPSYTARP